MVDGDRPRGMLAPADREYLQQGDEYGSSRQARSQRRQAVRQRTRDTILDFAVLFDRLDENEKKELWDEGFEGDPRPFFDGLAATIAFFFWGLVSEEDAKAWVDHDVNPRRGDLFVQVLKEGLSRGALKYDVLIDRVDLNVEGRRASEFDEKEAQRRAEAGEDFSPQFIRMLLETGMIGDDRIQEVVREELVKRSTSDE